MNDEISQAIERPKNVTIALRILWFFLIVGTGVLVAFFSLNWDAIYALLLERVRNTNLSEESRALVQNVVVIIVIGAIIFSVLLNMFLYYKIGKGRNWARIVFLVFAILSIAYQLNSAVKVGLLNSAVDDSNFASHLYHIMPGWILLTTGVGLLSAIGTVVALVLLFTKNANAWFQAKK